MIFEDSEKTVFDNFAEEFPDLTVTEIRNSLAAFMFYGEDVFKKINMLSGGEKVRLQLSKILKKGPNLLILDEPTNHMDIIGKESLENLLKEYTGTLIFVSHDRFFVNKIADSLLIFKKTGVQYYDGSYEQYEIENQNEEEEQEIKVKKEKVTNNAYLQKKEQNKKENRIKKLEKDIEKKENEIQELNNELLKEENYSNYEKLTEIQNIIEEKNNKLEEMMNEWMELTSN